MNAKKSESDKKKCERDWIWIQKKNMKDKCQIKRDTNAVFRSSSERSRKIVLKNYAI